jgi:hypothetical protein
MKSTINLVCILSVSFFATFSFADNKISDIEKLRPMTVYKSPTCGCCGEWVTHIEEANFATRIKHPENLTFVKEALGISPQYQSCHTGVKAGYFFEGHIPAEIIHRFLAESPKDVLGLAVPGMPLGSPGMDFGGDYSPYKVLLINEDGSSITYAEVSADSIKYSND